MDQKSQSKVIKAGFTIIHKDDQPSPRIKIKHKVRREWHSFLSFSTKAERDRYFKSLMESDFVISD